MSEKERATDELVSKYKTARHQYAIYSGSDGEVDHAIEAANRAHNLEDLLAEKGISRDKLREHWTKFAKERGLEH